MSRSAKDSDCSTTKLLFIIIRAWVEAVDFARLVQLGANSGKSNVSKTASGLLRRT